MQRVQGLEDAAEESLTQALDIWRELDDRRGIARVLHELALAAHARQRYTTCAELLNRSLEIALDLDAYALCADILASQAHLLAKNGQPDAAAQIVTFLASYRATSSLSRQSCCRRPGALIVSGYIQETRPHPESRRWSESRQVAQDACRHTLPVQREE